MSQQNVTAPICLFGGYLKRVTANLGFNSSPSTVDLEIVCGTGSVAEDVTNNATGFNESLAYPGNISGLNIGAFKFIGIITNWTENWSTAGRTYNIRLSDPRIIFDCIPVVLNSNVLGTGSYNNLLNVFDYYQEPSGGGFVEAGTLFRPVRDFLASTGTYVRIRDKRFNLILGSGFADGSGTINPNGITNWYRIKADYLSLNQLLQQVGEDNGFDFYSYIISDGYDPSTSIVNDIKIETIQRTQATGSTQIIDFVNGAIASGTLLSYKRGQELRPDCNAVVVTGPPLTRWIGFNSAPSVSPVSILPYWGRSSDGSAIFPPHTGSPGDRISGYVVLDHITGSGVNTRLSDTAFRIDYTKYTITSVGGSDVYPQNISIGISAAETTGYMADESVLRAALYNQESWEAMLFEKQPIIAQKLGILTNRFRNASDFQNQINNRVEIQRALSLTKTSISSGVVARDDYVNALIGAVYEATRSVADEFYGRQYICFVPGTGLGVFPEFDSDWLNNRTLSVESVFPTIEWEPIESAWSEGGLTSGVLNHEVLNNTNRELFKDSLGRLKAFVSYKEYQTGHNGFPYPIDTSVLSQGSYLIDQGDKLVVPINVEQYEKWPEYCIVKIDANIQGGPPAINATGYPEQLAMIDFLREMGYTKTQIDQYQLTRRGGESFEFGMAPPRPMNIECTAGNYGVHFPVQFINRNFGPWQSGALSPNLGCKLVQDNELGPWTFGGYANMELAAQQTIAKSLATSDVIDFADLTLAGLPVFNLGDNIGNNANITAISLQYGIDGLTTNYSVRTFPLSQLRSSQLLNNRITKVFTEANVLRREIININDRIERKNDSSQVNKVSEILSNDIKPKNHNNDSQRSFDFIISTVKPADSSGYYVN